MTESEEMTSEQILMDAILDLCDAADESDEADLAEFLSDMTNKFCEVPEL